MTANEMMRVEIRKRTPANGFDSIENCSENRVYANLIHRAASIGRTTEQTQRTIFNIYIFRTTLSTWPLHIRTTEQQSISRMRECKLLITGSCKRCSPSTIARRSQRRIADILIKLYKNATVYSMSMPLSVLAPRVLCSLVIE